MRSAINRIIGGAAIAVALLFFGCSGTPVTQATSATTYYRRDMGLTVNGQYYFGTAMVPMTTAYQIKAQSYSNFDSFRLQSCHREFAQDAVGSQFVNYSYVPVGSWDHGMRIEDSPECILDLAGFSASSTQNSWGIIAMQDPAGVTASVKCNGYSSSGTSTMCQAKLGSIQEIAFTQEMMSDTSNSPCNYGPTLKPKGRGKVFQYTMPDRACTLVFISTDGTMRTHKHISIGYEDIIIRGIK